MKYFHDKKMYFFFVFFIISSYIATLGLEILMGLGWVLFLISAYINHKKNKKIFIPEDNRSIKLSRKIKFQNIFLYDVTFVAIMGHIDNKWIQKPDTSIIAIILYFVFRMMLVYVVEKGESDTKNFEYYFINIISYIIFTYLMFLFMIIILTLAFALFMLVIYSM